MGKRRTKAELEAENKVLRGRIAGLSSQLHTSIRAKTLYERLAKARENGAEIKGFALGVLCGILAIGMVLLIFSTNG